MLSAQRGSRPTFVLMATDHSPVLLIAKIKGYPWWPARQEDPLKHGVTEKKVWERPMCGPHVRACCQSETIGL